MSGDRGAASALTLRCVELSQSLGGRTVVDRVSLEVAAGEVVGLLGPNGAGKTTIFRLLMGLLPGEQGVVTLEDPAGGDSRELGGLPPHARALAGLGYLPQTPSAFAGLSVLQNLEAVLELRRRPSDGARPWLERLGLWELRRQRAATLSGGERRRLELARLFCLAPAFLLLDEPFKGLDLRWVERITALLRRRAEEGTGVLLTDHRVHQTLAICRRAYILGGGKVLAQGSPAEVERDETARAIFWVEATGGAPAELDNRGERRT